MKDDTRVVSFPSDRSLGSTAPTNAVTRYYVEYQPQNGRPNNYTSFGSAMARALFIISLSPRATILREWESSGTESEP